MKYGIIEEWRDIPGFVGRYQASSLGKIRSLPNSRRKSVLEMKPRYHSKSGYLIIGLTSHDGVKHFQQTLWVARLIALTFHGKPAPGDEACHSDGDFLNNSKTNLRWGTKIENEADKKIHGTSNVGEQNPSARLNEVSVSEIREKIRRGVDSVAIAAEYGVSASTIKSIKTGQNWSAIK